MSTVLVHHDDHCEATFAEFVFGLVQVEDCNCEERHNARHGEFTVPQRCFACGSLAGNHPHHCPRECTDPIETCQGPCSQQVTA